MKVKGKYRNMLTEEQQVIRIQSEHFDKLLNDWEVSLVNLGERWEKNAKNNRQREECG